MANESAEIEPKISRPKMKVLYSVAATVVGAIGAGPWFVYHWQHRQVNDLKASLNATKDTEASSCQSTQEDLDLTVDKAVTANVTVPGDLIINVVAINITLTNSTDLTITVSPTVYQVKDASNHAYGSLFTSATGFGKDFVPLQATGLAPGQAVTGYVGI